MHRPTIAAAAALAVLALPAASGTAPPPVPAPAASASALERANPMQPSESWEALRFDLFGDRPIQDGSVFLEIEAPYRAEDAAVVPVRLTERAGSPLEVVGLTLVVDENPSPVVAEFTFGPGLGEVDFATRMRVDGYSNVRAVVETADGALYMVGRYVKASGGCSAPALKDGATAEAELGRMKLREYTAAGRPPGRGEAQVMIRHPNYSGLQMNQVTQLYIPAHFVNELEVRQGEELIFRMESGISISEDPSFRFGYDRNGATSITVRASDTDGGRFEQSFPLGTASAG